MSDSDEESVGWRHVAVATITEVHQAEQICQRWQERAGHNPLQPGLNQPNVHIVLHGTPYTAVTAHPPRWDDDTGRFHLLEAGVWWDCQYRHKRPSDPYRGGASLACYPVGLPQPLVVLNGCDPVLQCSCGSFLQLLSPEGASEGSVWDQFHQDFTYAFYVIRRALPHLAFGLYEAPDRAIDLQGYAYDHASFLQATAARRRHDTAEEPRDRLPSRRILYHFRLHPRQVARPPAPTTIYRPQSPAAHAEARELHSRLSSLVRLCMIPYPEDWTLPSYRAIARQQVLLRLHYQRQLHSLLLAGGLLSQHPHTAPIAAPSPELLQAHWRAYLRALKHHYGEVPHHRLQFDWAEDVAAEAAQLAAWTPPPHYPCEPGDRPDRDVQQQLLTRTEQLRRHDLCEPFPNPINAPPVPEHQYQPLFQLLLTHELPQPLDYILDHDFANSRDVLLAIRARSCQQAQERVQQLVDEPAPQ